MLMRDIDCWCLIETCLYVNERYRLGDVLLNHVSMLMRDPDWWCHTESVCMLMRNIDWWWLIETCLYVNERYRLVMSYWNMIVC